MTAAPVTGRTAPAARRTERGFTLFELVTVICLIALLAIIGNNRLRYYQELAEKAVMDMTLSAMTAGLRYRMAQMMINGSQRTLGELELANPVNFLQEPPRTYLGEFLAADVKAPAGSWYYDAGRHEIVYIPAIVDNLAGTGPDPAPERLRFRVKLVYDRPIDVTVSDDRPAVVGLRINPAVNYKWF